MAEIASAFVSLMPSAKGFGSKMESEVGGEVNGAGKRLGSSFGKMFAVAGGLLAAAGIGSFLKDSIGEAREAQKVGALTESIIKSTGGAANLTAKQVGNLASSLSLKTGMDDEAIQSGANLLLTFKNVRNEVGEGNKIFNRATSAAADLSAAGFGALEGTSKQLGKALNDPIKGISALGRAGVTFTEGQQKQIKALVESGDVLKAQKIILGEVESQVGGAAAASATAGEKASVAFGNLKEQIGTKLLPVVDAAANKFLEFVPAISRGIDQIGPLFNRAITFLQPFITQVRSFFAGEGRSAISGFATQAVALFQTHLLPVLQTAAATFQNVILPAVTSLVTYVATSLAPVLQQVAQIIVTRVLPIVSSLAQFFYGTLYPAIVGIATAVAKNLKPVFDQLVATFRAKVLPTVDKLLANFQKYQPTIQKVIGVVVKVIGKVLEFAAAILGKVLPVVIRFQAFLISNLVSAGIKVIGAFVNVVKGIIDFGKKVIDAAKKVAEFQRAVAEKVAKVVTAITGLPGKIKGALSGAIDFLKQAGIDIIQGLINGIDSKIDDVTGKLKGLTDKLPDWKGPAARDKTLLRPAGQLIIRGLVDGFDDAIPLVKKKLGQTTKLVKKLLAKGADKDFVAGLTKGLVIDWAKVVGLKGKGAEKALDAMRERLTKALDKMTSALQKQIDDTQKALDGMKAFASSISSAFKVDLFSGSLTDLFKNGLGNNATVKAVMAGFKKLVGAGYSKGFLSSLIQSGNSGLILELANADASTVKQAQAVFADQNALTSQLGTYAAQFNSGQTFKGVEQRLDALNDKMRDLPANIGAAVGKSLNGAASQGKRNQDRGGRGGK